MAFHAELGQSPNKSLKYVSGLTVVHRTPLSGRRLALRYVSSLQKVMPDI